MSFFLSLIRVRIVDSSIERIIISWGRAKDAGVNRHKNSFEYAPKSMNFLGKFYQELLADSSKIQALVGREPGANEVYKVVSQEDKTFAYVEDNKDGYAQVQDINSLNLHYDNKYYIAVLHLVSIQ